MKHVVLRRSTESAASANEAASVVAAYKGNVIDRSDNTMLIDVAGQATIALIRGDLPGWIVAEQGSSGIPVPDTRLKLLSSD